MGLMPEVRPAGAGGHGTELRSTIGAPAGAEPTTVRRSIGGIETVNLSGWSGAKFDPRPQCTGWSTKNSLPCKAKCEVGEVLCGHHQRALDASVTAAS